MLKVLPPTLGSLLTAECFLYPNTIKQTYMKDGTIQQLNILLKKTYDTLKYYQQAATIVDSGNTHEFFNRKANERYVFGNQIKDEIKALNGKPYDKGELDHLEITPWFKIKKRDKKSTPSDSAIMQECQQAEVDCLKDYYQLLNFPSLPDSTRKLLQDQSATLAGVQWDVELAALISKIEDETL